MEASAKSQSPQGADPADLILEEWELATIELFVHAAQLVGVSKSVGQIYGILFCSTEALPMDSIVDKLAISKGSASQGLKTLRQLGAVSLVFQHGDRRDHYAPELSLRKLVSGFLSDQLSPHLQNGSQRLEHIQSLLPVSDSENHEQVLERLSTLRTWNAKMSKLLPLIQRIL